MYSTCLCFKLSYVTVMWLVVMYLQQPPFRPRAANILSCRQPSCVEEAQGEERPPRQPAGRHKEARHKAGGAGASCTSNTEWRSTTLTSLKSQDPHKGSGVKLVPKVRVRLFSWKASTHNIWPTSVDTPPHQQIFYFLHCSLDFSINAQEQD